ncbi:hypothetical protein E3N88_35498 [Mikania micrantha]|uniref:Serine-threonine/tyrosine-protein kinase catalytic domain-containing protein n=1 Tax=Mikania micrantha TaxID=192012 RepID=A0A5N6M191_9ASTR|nr:hypothetical protein E3N88_35498 [Mikania micrantha]
MCVVMDDDGFMLSAPLVKDYYQKKKLDEIVDPALSHQISFESMNKFSSIAYQCLHDDRKQRPPMHLVKKELEELLKMELPSYALETPSRISSLNEASYGSDVERQGFDETLQAQAGNVVGNLDAGVKDTSISFDLEKEISTKINQDEVKVVLNSNKGIWKSQKLVHLVEDYLETNLETLDLCDSVMTSLKRVRETRLLIFEALHHFDDEDLAKENSYEKTLYNLKNLKAVGDIFTKDFFWIFNFVHRKQIAFLERLQLKKAKLYKVLDQTWVYSLLKNHKNGTKMRKTDGSLTSKNCFSHVAVDRASYGSSDVKVQGFDQTLQARADNVISNLDSDVISNLDSGLEDRAMSFFAEMYRNEKLALYKSKTSVVNNLKLANLVKDYQDINNQALGLSNSLRTCLKRLQETHHSILECVRHVHYEKTLVHLKSLKAAGDPFTQDFFKIFNFVYRRKIAFLEKLQRKKVKLCKKLDQTWFTKRVNSVLKAYKNKETEGHKEAIVFMQVVSYRGIRDMGKIQFLVNKLQMDVENFMRNAEFATKMKDAVKYVTDNMTEKLNSFLKNADALEDMSNVYTVDVQKAKTVTRITNPPASDS